MYTVVAMLGRNSVASLRLNRECSFSDVRTLFLGFVDACFGFVGNLLRGCYVPLLVAHVYASQTFPGSKPEAVQPGKSPFE